MGPKSTCAPRLAVILLTVFLAGLAVPAAASAHGPVNPAATSYLAAVRNSPSGTRATVVDGDQRMWLAVRPGEQVVVLDYRGAPYLRFSGHGVEVNRNSSMYYLNQVPAELVPAGIGPRTPPDWTAVTSGHGYGWHDGRLHALATTALAPGTRYVGSWSIPLRVDGRRATITGSLDYAPNPSLVWFWPIIVALVSVLAGLRLRRPGLDAGLARGISAVALAGFAVAGAGQQLHGRPGVAIGQYIEFGLLLLVVVWGARRVLLGHDGWFGYFLIALAALWEGASLIGVLTHGFVLVALPATVARVAVTLCLAAGVAMLPVIFRLAERPERAPAGVGAGAGEGLAEDEAWDEL